jgi:tRNA A37 N6-isopentenylltransferase MiaA
LQTFAHLVANGSDISDVEDRWSRYKQLILDKYGGDGVYEAFQRRDPVRAAPIKDMEDTRKPQSPSRSMLARRACRRFDDELRDFN